MLYCFSSHNTPSVLADNVSNSHLFLDPLLYPFPLRTRFKHIFQHHFSTTRVLSRPSLHPTPHYYYLENGSVDDGKPCFREPQSFLMCSSRLVKLTFTLWSCISLTVFLFHSPLNDRTPQLISVSSCVMIAPNWILFCCVCMCVCLSYAEKS